MSAPTIGSILLASSNPERLRDWYVAALAPKVERTPGEPAYDVLDFDGFYLMLDRRQPALAKVPVHGQRMSARKRGSSRRVPP